MSQFWTYKCSMVGQINEGCRFGRDTVWRRHCSDAPATSPINHRTALNCSAVQCSAVQCSAVQCSACSAVVVRNLLLCCCYLVSCKYSLYCHSQSRPRTAPAPGVTLLYCTVLYCTVLYCTALYCTVLYCNVLYCTVLCCTVLCCIVLCNVLYTIL